jgi:hypothetical protein
MVGEADPDAQRVTGSVTGDVSGFLVQAGRIDGGIHYHRPPSERRVVEWPYRYGIVPPRATAFQEREVRQLVADTFDAAQTSVVSTRPPTAATLVATGLGGVGKTQLVAEYAQTAWAAHQLDLLVWITATSRAAIQSDYGRLADELSGVDNDSDTELAARRLVSWLASTQRRWLVVLDDVQDPGDLRELWPPASPHGRTLVTTRRRDAAFRGQGRRMIDVDVFSQPDAITYLNTALAGQPELINGAADLAAQLGRLPIALAQAATYLLDRNLSCAAYLARWSDRRHRLTALVPEPGSLPDDHRTTLAVTWSLSVELANRLEPTGLAGVLLEVVSLLDANGIPAEVFTAEPILNLLHDSLDRPVDAQQARDGLGCLHRLSLITWVPTQPRQAVRVHALVQRATRERIAESRWPVLVEAAAAAVLAAWPEIERDAVLGQIYRANTDALVDAAGEVLWDSEAYAVMFRAGNSLGNSGLAATGRDYYERLHALTRHHLGTDHRRTTIAAGNLANLRGKAGDAAGAAAAFEALLAERLRLFGPDDRHTLGARFSLAQWRGEMGDAAGAAATFEQVQADYLRVRGPDHLTTLAARHQLARWRGEAGDGVGAAAALEELLADRIRVLGRDHPDTLSTRHDLAQWRMATHDRHQTSSDLEALLTDRIRVLGLDHPDTLKTRHSLANWGDGDADQAAADLEVLLADQVRILGPDHPDTLLTRYHIGYLRGQRGDCAGAVADFEALLADRTRVLGPRHPDTLTTRHGLACWRGENGDTTRAVADYEELLADRLRILGPDHPHILPSRHGLARWCAEDGDIATAIIEMRNALADYRLRLDQEDAYASLLRDELATWRRRAGPTAESVTELEALLPDQQRVLGPDQELAP